MDYETYILFYGEMLVAEMNVENALAVSDIKAAMVYGQRYHQLAAAVKAVAGADPRP